MTPEKDSFSSKFKQLEEEVKEMKEQLEKKPHLTISVEHDLDIKSHIIDKQNEMIELLIEQAKDKLAHH